MAVGIICEYNPFHNGHLYHINRIKEMYPDELIVLVMSGNFTQRGDISIIEKYDKADIALTYGVDLVVELPFFFATQSADIFAKGSVELLNHLKCNKIVFGSESNNIDELTMLANIQINDDDYNIKVKEELDKGNNYPTAMSNALRNISFNTVNTPNDLLALSYVKEIVKNGYRIEAVSIKRTNDYHDIETKDIISSATSIRKAILDNKNINDYVPKYSLKFIQKDDFNKKYFDLLKYKIISEGISIRNYYTVDEGIENRILKNINSCSNLEELIQKTKSKRYTYSKLKRMFIHILCSFTKEERMKKDDVDYIKILGFNQLGKEYLNEIKKDTNIPIITNINKNNIKLLEQELKCDQIYNILTNRNDNLFGKKPIIKP